MASRELLTSYMGQSLKNLFFLVSPEYLPPPPRAVCSGSDTNAPKEWVFEIGVRSVRCIVAQGQSPCKDMRKKMIKLVNKEADRMGVKAAA